MSTTQSETSDSPMEIVLLEEDGDSVTEVKKPNKKPEGSRKVLGKT